MWKTLFELSADLKIHVSNMGSRDPLTNMD